MQLNELQISDGKILRFTSDLQGLNVIFQDWKEQKWSLLFYEVLAIQSFSVEGEELSHLTISKDDAFKTMTLDYYSDEDPKNFNCYSFSGVWNNNVIFKIVAKDHYLIEAINE